MMSGGLDDLAAAVERLTLAAIPGVAIKFAKEVGAGSRASLSLALASLLRHEVEGNQLSIDGEGWTTLDAVVTAMAIAAWA